MKFLELMRNGVSVSFKRFPVVTLIVVFAVLAGLRFVYVSNHYDDVSIHNNEMVIQRLISLLVISNFAAMIGLAFDLYCEKNNKSGILRWSLRLLSIIAGIMLFLFLDIIALNTNKITIAVLCVSAHFAVSSLPFIFQKSWTGFWEFNKELFLRIQLSLFYSGVIFLGLCLAVLAQSELLSLYKEKDIYGYLAVIVFIGFNTLFFVSGIPQLNDQSERVEYPVGLKIFSGYVILPLVAIYLLILLSFELKILLGEEKPEGFVSWMIFCFAVAGILAFLLLYPILGNKENKWIRLSLRVFSFSLIPLLILLWWAIWIRVDEYGWTEMRYIHVCLSVWLTFFVIYFNIRNDKVIIKWLPLSIAILGMFISFGPWGYSSVSRNSQKSFIDKYLSSEDSVIGSQLVSKIEYLVKNHGFESVREYVTPEGQDIILGILDSTSSDSWYVHYKVSDYVIKHLTFELPEQTSGYRTDYSYQNISFHTSGVFNTEQFRYFINTPSYFNEIEYKEHGLKLYYDQSSQELSITYKGHKEVINIRQHVENNIQHFKKYTDHSYNDMIEYNEKEMAYLHIEIPGGNMKVIITDMDISIAKDGISGIWGTQYLLLFN